MSFTAAATQPAPRDPELPWEENGPGLYQFGETGGAAPELAVELDDGELIAVSVEMEWLENNAGLAMHGWARWINPDGSSRVDASGKVIETSVASTITALEIERHGQDAMAREVMRAVLGEPPARIAIESDGVIVDQPEVPDGVTLDPTASERDLLPISETTRKNASIRAAINLVKTAVQGCDPAQVFDL